mmetsp:Transcript_42773/g.121982  ORF Transcript_42773/g.121982 Transcript_42773/m.121982 type:complete len:284 (+) Transcript_42773:517-1368(+)
MAVHAAGSIPAPCLPPPILACLAAGFRVALCADGHCRTRERVLLLVEALPAPLALVAIGARGPAAAPALPPHVLAGRAAGAGVADGADGGGLQAIGPRGLWQARRRLDGRGSAAPSSDLSGRSVGASPALLQGQFVLQFLQLALQLRHDPARAHVLGRCLRACRQADGLAQPGHHARRVGRVGRRALVASARVRHLQVLKECPGRMALPRAQVAAHAQAPVLTSGKFAIVLTGLAAEVRMPNGANRRTQCSAAAVHKTCAHPKWNLHLAGHGSLIEGRGTCRT